MLYAEPFRHFLYFCGTIIIIVCFLCPTEITEIFYFAPCGAFLLFPSFLWDNYLHSNFFPKIFGYAEPKVHVIYTKLLFCCSFIKAFHCFLLDSVAFGAECGGAEAKDSLDGFVVIAHFLQDE